MSILTGTHASDGIGIGTTVVANTPELHREPTPVADIEAEKARLTAAIEAYTAAVLAQAEQLECSVGQAEADILRGHVLMIRDPYMHGDMLALIESGMCAEEATSRICEQFAATFEASDNDVIQARATDVRDVCAGVLAKLAGVDALGFSELPPDCVLVTHELTPSMVAGLNRENVVALVAETGSATSHAAILARALDIPTVLAVAEACAALPSGTLAVVNALEGTVTVDPDDATLAAARSQLDALRSEQEHLAHYAGLPTVTGDGARLLVTANIHNVAEARRACECDAEGVGLLRTEFLFMDARALPTEDQQYEAYTQVVKQMEGGPVTIRTLDIGGDKCLTYLDMAQEANPLLGLRGIRYCLQHEDVFRTQLRALLRAAAYGDVRITIPLVTCVDEIREVKSRLARYAEELEREGVAGIADVAANLQVGVMVETPAAALMASALADEADFFSIGTNDLTGYIMASDRANASVRSLYSAHNPAVLRAIHDVAAAGQNAGIAVEMCGEAAADPLLIPVWIAFGIDEFSVNSASILRTRKEIQAWTRSEAAELADAVMRLTTEREVREALVAARK